METKEKEKENRLPIPTKAQMTVLRMAAGVHPPIGPLFGELRNHLVVPSDHANPLFEAAASLEALGALTTSPQDAGLAGEEETARGEDTTYLLTPIGREMVRPAGPAYLERGLTLEGVDGGGPRVRAIEHLLAAQGHLLEARTLIEKLPAQELTQGMINFLSALTLFLGLIGETAHQLRNPAPKSRKWA